MKAVYGPSTQGPTLLRTMAGTLVKDSESIQTRWREHLYHVLNREVEVEETFINERRQFPIRHNLADPPTQHEVMAIKSLNNDKASGPDGIPAEVLKYGGPAVAQRLHSVFGPTVCGNCKGISLLSTVGKLFAKVILNRLTQIAEVVLPDTQCGFRPARGTIDMIFALRQVQEKSREQRTPLYTAFFDLTKAFDTVHRETLWIILSKYGSSRQIDYDDPPTS